MRALFTEVRSDRLEGYRTDRRLLIASIGPEPVVLVHLYSFAPSQPGYDLKLWAGRRVHPLATAEEIVTLVSVTCSATVAGTSTTGARCLDASGVLNPLESSAVAESAEFSHPGASAFADSVTTFLLGAK